MHGPMIMSVIQQLHVREKVEGFAPIVHGNGFLIVPLDGSNRRRVHIWGHPGLPRQKVATPIHNHRFNFISTCLAGRVFNLTYGVQMDPDPEPHP